MDLARRVLDDGGDQRREGIALFVDGPNVLRDEFDVDLDDVREAAQQRGRLAVARLYLNEHAPPGLIQAAEARGYEVVTTSGDVDVRLAVDIADVVFRSNVETVAIASRDTDFKPALELCGREGVKTLAIAPGSYGRSDALRNAADESLTLDGASDEVDEAGEDDSTGADEPSESGTSDTTTE